MQSPQTAGRPPESRAIDGIEPNSGGLRIHHYRPGVLRETRGLVVLAPGGTGGMGPGQEGPSHTKSLFSTHLTCIYTTLAKQLADDGFAVCQLTWRSPPAKSPTAIQQLKLPAALREGAYDIAAAAKYLRVAHEAESHRPSLPLVLVGFCFGAAAAAAAAARSLNGEQAFARMGPLAGVISLSLALRVDGPGRDYAGYDSVACAQVLGNAGVPLLIMHGLVNGTVDPSQADMLLEASPGPKAAVWLIGAGHQLIERASDVNALLSTWMSTLFRRYDVVGRLGFQDALRVPEETGQGISFGRAQTI
jgi:pimeloyl-ACP methyl ester carboxylesterase